MALSYGCLKARIISNPALQPSRHNDETLSHLHATLQFTDASGQNQHWDCSINVGTNDSDDLLQYKLVFDYQHPLVAMLKNLPAGFADLTGTDALLALDYLRSDILQGTGDWRDSNIMDGSDQVEPVLSLMRLLRQARAISATVYVLGREYTDGAGIHDVHMNQGSTGSFLNNGIDDHNDHNDVWQDGAVIVDLGDPQLLAAYFPAFTQQMVPTDQFGNPQPASHPMTSADYGSLQ